MVIWKDPFKITSTFSLMMPKGARPLTAQLQDGVPVMWAAVDPVGPQVQYWFSVRPTGGQTDGNSPNYAAEQYIATFQGGSFVWHLFRTLS